MNQKGLINHIKKLHEVEIKLIKTKNEDYADPSIDAFLNFRSSELIDINYKKAILIRILDKLSRINNLMKKGNQGCVKEESLDDTISDCRNYLGILSAAIKDESNKNGKH